MIRVMLAATLLLAACTNAPPLPVNPSGYVPLEYQAPLALRALLPRGISTADLREDNGCYGYLLNGEVFPVLRPDGGQYCMGTG